MKIEGKKILLISPEPWGINYVSKHHYANYLSQKNEVYFLNPAVSYSKNPFGSIHLNQQQIAPNLTQLSYKNLLPKLNNLPKAVQARIYKKQAQEIQKSIGIEVFDLVWSFDPFRFWNLNVFKSQKSIYHTVDFHPNAKYEQECITSADIVLCVTELVKEELNTAKTIHLIGHGADLDGFNSNNTANIHLPGSNKTKACYVGNFHNHIDYSILSQLCLENESVDFIMIGPTLDSNLSSGNSISKEILSQFSTYKNLHFIGSVPSKELMSYLQKIDINLVLFKKENERIHCSPHKLMGYFFSGKITLSNYVDEHKSTDQDIILMTQDQHEIPVLFKKIVTDLQNYNAVSSQEKRKKFAEMNSYQNKIDEIAHLLYE